MYFIKNITRKLLAISCKLSTFRNLPPRLVGGQATTYHLPARHDYYRACRAWQSNNGFTLIETLVAISILMIAIASPLTIAQKGVASAIYAKDQIIASYLAQDAIEFIINWSDGNKKSGKDWLDGITGGVCNDSDSACRVDTVSGSDEIINCNSDVCENQNLNYSDAGYYYSHGSGNPSVFNRSVFVEEVQSGIEALITVKMSWSDKGKNRPLTFQTRIFNWK